MHVMGDREARAWCTGAGFKLMDRGWTLRYAQLREHRFFVLPPEEFRIINYLARTIVTFRGAAHFAGGLLWLTRWDLGSPELVAVGWRLVEGIRRAKGVMESIEASPGHFFRTDELVDLHALLVQVMAFGWVAEYVPGDASFFLHFKNNRQICVTSNSEGTSKELRATFGEWNPTDEDPMVLRLRESERKHRNRKSIR